MPTEKAINKQLPVRQNFWQVTIRLAFQAKEKVVSLSAGFASLTCGYENQGFQPIRN
ncbi:MAG: hypothetical protein LBN23_00880 [Paludibacter sp.]|nr:hypothetical protein [Paludibacter sp.]